MDFLGRQCWVHLITTRDPRAGILDEPKFPAISKHIHIHCVNTAVGMEYMGKIKPMIWMQCPLLHHGTRVYQLTVVGLQQE